MRDFDERNAVEALLDEAALAAPDDYRAGSDFVVVLCRSCGTRLAEVMEYHLVADHSPLRDPQGRAVGALLIVHERYPVSAEERGTGQRFPDRALRFAAALQRPDLGPLPAEVPVWCHSCRGDGSVKTADLRSRIAAGRRKPQKMRVSVRKT